MADEALLRRLDAVIDRLVKAKATPEESKAAIREALHREPRTWDSADISYDTPEPE